MNKVGVYIAAVLGVIILAAGAVVIINNINNDDPETAINSQLDSSTQEQLSQVNGTAPKADNEISNEPNPQAVSVDISNYAYKPEPIAIKAGTTVTWTNRDSVGHDITPDKETAEFKQSELLSRGDSYNVLFNTPGTYTYHCSPHPYMTGTVVVTE